MDEAIETAKTLGKKVMLIGLSTGGALALDRAYRAPRGVAGVVAVAPAIGIANPLMNVLEKLSLVEPLSQVLTEIGRSKTTQLEVRQLRLNTHALHEVYELGKSIQAESEQPLPVPTLLVTSSNDKMIVAEKVVETYRRNPNSRWLCLQQDLAEQTVPRVEVAGRQTIVHAAEVPVHNGMVYDPRYASHLISDENPLTAKSRLPFVSTQEVNPHFQIVMQTVSNFLATDIPSCGRALVHD